MSTEERLISAARDLLWERGYVGTSPRAIQQHAEVGQGSMYHHFSGKHDLARQAIIRAAEELRVEAARDLAAPGTAGGKLVAYLTRQRDVLRGCPVGRLAADPEIVAAADLREPLQETFAWLQSQLADVIREGQHSGELTAVLDPGATAAAIISAVQGGYVLARSANDPEQFDKTVGGLLALLGLTQANGNHE